MPALDHPAQLVMATGRQLQIAAIAYSCDECGRSIPRGTEYRVTPAYVGGRMIVARREHPECTGAK